MKRNPRATHASHSVPICRKITVIDPAALLLGLRRTPYVAEVWCGSGGRLNRGDNRLVGDHRHHRLAGAGDAVRRASRRRAGQAGAPADPMAGCWWV
ncbi:hypothetical protein DSL40_05725, partial [Mycobacterium tuberculosis]